ncbi:MAG: hypothetical protein V7609_786 [Verrucomicrobiota bacterium]
MKINIKQTFGLAAASCLALAGQSFAAPPAGHGSGFSAPGNSAFGHSQGMSPTTGSINSSYGRTNAANARAKSNSDVEDQDDQDRAEVKTKKVKKTKLTNPGNSAFGRSQRINHLKGSGNNIYGKTTSANAKIKNANKKNSHATDR